MSKLDEMTLEEWAAELKDREDQLDTRQSDLESREIDVSVAELRAADVLQRAADLREALDWARDPNPAMGRAEQRLVLRTLLFNVEPDASYLSISELAERMLP